MIPYGRTLDGAAGGKRAIDDGAGGGKATGSTAVPPSMPWIRDDASDDDDDVSKMASSAPCSKRRWHSYESTQRGKATRRGNGNCVHKRTFAASRTRRDGSSPFSGCTAPRYSAKGPDSSTHRQRDSTARETVQTYGAVP